VAANVAADVIVNVIAVIIGLTAAATLETGVVVDSAVELETTHG